MRFGSLFAGIGGFDLGFERAGLECAWQVENDPWCNRVLAKHWPEVPRYGDVQSLRGSDLEAVDIICGGFPCQPVSVAGRRSGQDDERWLWPHFARLVDEIRPRYVVVENVPGLFTAGGTEVFTDLAALGFDAVWHCVSAASLGAPHLRWRVIIVAHASGAGSGGIGRVGGSAGDEGRPAGGAGITLVRSEDGEARTAGAGESGQDVAYAEGNGVGAGLRQDESAGVRGRRSGDESGARIGWWEAEPDVGRVADGVPKRMDRLKGLGNALVPQLAEAVGGAIIRQEAKRMAEEMA